jgi:hypothetical protein
VAELGRVSINAARIRDLVRRADNDSEQEEVLAEYLTDSALDIADALERGTRAEAALRMIVEAWPIPSEAFTAALVTGRAALAAAPAEEASDAH